MILDHLDWRPWPKEPDTWLYADIADVARLAKHLPTDRFWVRELDGEGWGGWHFTGRREDELLDVLQKILNGRSMPAWLRLREAVATQPEPEVIKECHRKDIDKAFPNDAWQRNYALNWWEATHKLDKLESYPWRVTLPIADLCNARCTFCTSWLSGRNVMSPDQLDRYLEVLPFAREIGIQGHGEPLANPHIDTILAKIGEATDPRAESYIITNGAFFPRRIDALLKARVKTFNFSLNATTPDVHNTVMGLGPDALSKIIDGIKDIIAIRDSGRENRPILVTISMVLNADNIHQAADFVRLGNDLGVTRVYLRTLMPVPGPVSGLNYHRLSPCLHPEFERHAAEARAAIAASKVEVEAFPETWAHDAFPPSQRTSDLRVTPRETALADPDLRQTYKDFRAALSGHGRRLRPSAPDGESPYGRKAPFDCNFIYQQLISTQLSFRLVPCCYMSDVPDHEPLVFDGTRPFRDYWNSEAMMNLRRTLREGPLYNECRTCPMQG